MQKASWIQDAFLFEKPQTNTDIKRAAKSMNQF